ncbi:MAG: DUF3570 domain-containing protein [Cytophagaceae bacterium]
MRKISLAAIAFYVSLLSAFAQEPVETDTSSYKSRKLKLNEVNFVSSYYTQDGNNSAVTGGTGTEKLTDFSNQIELRFVKKDVKERERILNLQAGVDSYTSASSDNIDPSTISGASRSERRIYPNVSYTVKNTAKRKSIGFSGYYSKEFDYNSIAPGITFSKDSKDNNASITVKLQAFFDNRKIILPIELRNIPDAFTGTTHRYSYNASLIYSLVINQRMQMAGLLDMSLQEGLLSTPFNRVYLAGGGTTIEKLPSSRLRIPLGFRANYFLSGRYIIRTFYRFYFDTWNLKAHTFTIELPVKITPFLSLGPIYRFYTQSGVKYFAPYQQHTVSEEFYTSDYDLSTLSSQLIGLNLRKVSAEGILGIKKWNAFEIRYSYYYRSTRLSAHSIALAFKFK